jgi:hypothetical protein
VDHFSVSLLITILTLVYNSIYDSTEEAIKKKMIEASQSTINEQNNLIVNKHFELQIKTLQNALRGVDKLEQVLKIRIKPAKDPAEYVINNPNKKIGMLLGARAGDVSWYFKTDIGVSINLQEIGISKYKAMLMAIVKDAVEILGHSNAEKIEE